MLEINNNKAGATRQDLSRLVMTLAGRPYNYTRFLLILSSQN